MKKLLLLMLLGMYYTYSIGQSNLCLFQTEVYSIVDSEEEPYCVGIFDEQNRYRSTIDGGNTFKKTKFYYVYNGVDYSLYHEDTLLGYFTPEGNGWYCLEYIEYKTTNQSMLNHKR